MCSRLSATRAVGPQSISSGSSPPSSRKQVWNRPPLANASPLPRNRRRTLATRCGLYRELRSRIDEAVADRVASELHTVTHPELLEDVRTVAIDGLLADDERLGNLPVGVALGHELDHFGLSGGQRVARLLA